MPDDSSLSPLARTGDWLLYSQGRSRQRTCGLVAALMLILAFAVLVDGLLAHMRGGGSYRLEMLAGTSEAISGPLGSATAKEEDLRAFPVPMDAPISFDFEGFFSSYWFGSGMWRGVVHVSETAASGTYALAVGIEGQASSSFQTYTISVARTRDEHNRQSLSAVRRLTGANPFILAAILWATGLGIGAGCFLLGRRCNALLADLGLAEIFKVMPEGELVRVFAVTGKRAVEGKSFVAYDATLRRLGKAIYDREKNGLTECLFVPGDHGLPRKGSFIAFWPRELPTFAPPRRGLLSRVIGRKEDRPGEQGVPAREEQGPERQ